jgi:hypothetical protein
MMFLADNDGVFGGLAAGIIGIGILMLALCWIVFPLIVVAKFNVLIREVRALRGDIQKGKEENVQRPTLNVQSRIEEKKPEPAVYKID